MAGGTFDFFMGALKLESRPVMIETVGKPVLRAVAFAATGDLFLVFFARVENGELSLMNIGMAAFTERCQVVETDTML